MKRFILLALASVLMLSGCSGTNVNNNSVEPSTSLPISPPSSEKDQYVVSESKEKHAQILLEEMMGGNFLSVEQALSEDLAKKITLDQIKIAFSQVMYGQGYEGVTKKDSHKSEGLINVQITSKLSTRMLEFNTSFNADGKLVGIGFTYAPLVPVPEETAELIEKSISVGGDDLELNGMLTLPKNVTNPPVAILVQGSGSHGMDSAIGTSGNKPFKDIAHGLAKEGIASIRYDKRFYSHPQLADQGINIENEVLKDVYDIITFAQESEDVDKDNIYIIGHSLGGMLAPKIAIDNKAVKGIISLAGTPRYLEDIMMDQNIVLLKKNGISEKEIEQILAQLKDEIEQIKKLTSDTPPSILVTQPSSYWYSLTQATGPKNATEFSCPALILQGDMDFQISSTGDFSYWQELLKNRTDVEFKLYEGLNHLFMKSDGTQSLEEYNAPAHVEQQVISYMAQWVKTQAKL